MATPHSDPEAPDDPERPLLRGQFVEILPSADAPMEEAAWRYGKVVESGEEDVLISFFLSPAEEPQERRIPVARCRGKSFSDQTRVFMFDESDEYWQVGRVVDGGVFTIGTDPTRYYMVRFPNTDEPTRIAEAELAVRVVVPVEDPTPYLASRCQETAFWQHGRQCFRDAVVEQRARYAGMSGLASSSIDVTYVHQLAAIRAVLRDPVQRYILADEVGLGKTIEAGVIVRQHLIDQLGDARVLLVVPDHLTDQWREELEKKLNLGDAFDASSPRGGNQLQVVSFSEFSETSAKSLLGVSMLVVDEAHHLSAHAWQSNASHRATYEKARQLAQQASGVLLLSATPVLHNERGFLAMLHLLDPQSYRLEDVEGFRARVQAMDPVGSAVYLLEDDAVDSEVEEALEALKALPDGDSRLGELMQAVQARCSADEDDEERMSAIAALRIHVQETHRLHRRLIRSRRSGPVRDDLPNREVFECVRPLPQAQVVAEALEDWRRSAKGACDSGACDAARAQDVLKELVGAFFEGARAFRRAAQGRLAVLAGVGSGAFDTESELLRDVLDRTAGWVDDELESLVAAIHELRRGRSDERCIVFCSDSTLADAVSARLAGPGRNVLRYGADGARQLAKSVLATSILVCDRAAEDGLNLHSDRAFLVHADIPLNPNRIEQRIGRLDRIGGAGARRVSSYLVHSESDYERRWVECLREGMEIFDSSIADLQYYLEEEMRTASAELLANGPLAFSDLTGRLRGENDFDSGLAVERRRIRNIELLDGTHRVDSRVVDFRDALEDKEYADSEPLQKALRVWANECLQFSLFESAPSTSKRRTLAEYAYRHAGIGRRPRGDRNRQLTLLSLESIQTYFAGQLRVGANGAAFPTLSFDRTVAVEEGYPVARIGTPLVDAMERATRADDRGMAFAFYRSSSGFALPERVAARPVFRFEFEFEAVVDVHEARRCELVASALSRKADEFLAPQRISVWLTHEGDEVTDQTTLALLDHPYDSRSDINLNRKTWRVIDGLHAKQLLEFGDWERLCFTCRDEASALVNEKLRIDEVKQDAERKASRQYQDIELGLRSRVAHLAGTADSKAVKVLEEHQREHRLLVDALRSARLRLDSVGAVFLSNQSWPPQE